MEDPLNKWQPANYRVIGGLASVPLRLYIITVTGYIYR
jgi:hypothetical protein